MAIETHYPMLGFIVIILWLLFVKLSLIEDTRYPSWVWRAIQWVTILIWISFVIVMILFLRSRH
jgi:hypothetical protein